MVFKVIDGNFTTIFNKTKNVSEGFSLASNELNRFVEGFNRLNSSQNFGSRWESFLNGASSKNANLVTYFEDLAKQGASAKANIEGVYAAILDGNTRGIGNVKSVISMFNSVNPESQKDFANAVKQTNSQLGNYLSNLNGAKASLSSYAGQVALTTAKTVALKVASVALNATIVGVISWGIGKFVSELDDVIVTEEEAKQKAEELKQQTLENAQAAKEELNKISDLISQYEKFKDVTSLTADDKETLKSIQDQLVETFGKEAEGIDLVNGEYREQLGLLKGIKQEKSNQNINALISNKDTVKKEYDDNVKNTFEYYGGGDEDFYHNSEYVTMIKKLIQNNPAFTDDIIYSGWGAQYGKTVGSAKITLSDNLNAEEKVQALQEALEYMRAEGYTDNELFRYFSNIQQHYQEEVDNYNNALKDLAQGYIDAFEPLKDDATLKEFNAWKEKLLESIDDEEVKSATSELVDSLYKETSSVPNNTTILNLDKVSEDAKNALSEYEDKISDFLSEKDKIDAALQEQEENGSISVSTAFELSQAGYQSAIKYDSETKAYKLLRSEINKTAESRRAETKAKLESEKASAIQSIKDETENWRKNTGRTKDDIMYLDKLEKNKIAIQEISDTYDFYIRMLEIADDTTSEYADSIAKVNEQLEKQKEEIENLESGQSAIDKAIEEQKEFGHLSASSIKALHEAGLGTALAYNEATGETNLLIDSVEELYQAMIKAQEEAAKISLNNLATEIEEIENRLNNFTVNSAGDVQKKAELENDLAEKQSQYDTQQQNIQVISSYKFDFNSTSEDIQQSAEEAVEEYINSIKEAFDKEKSILDHLSNMDAIPQEEYYNRLFALNEKYFKGKTELLDEYRQYEEEVYKGLKQVQIDAIQEQIDALKSVNEEKQEEIDLEKAKQALENAKRQKTISVYDSERGWIHETDRDAIDSAQKEYDDLVLNEKVETLENLIDAIENGTNTSHQIDESVNAIEQINALGQRVIPGNVDLLQLFGITADKMSEIQNSVNSNNVPATLANQFEKSISSDSYTTNTKTINVNVDKVVADDPVRFMQQMEDIADERFKENFPSAMNQFGRDLQRYKMNHSN